MKLLVYSAKDFEIPFLKDANVNNSKVTYIKDALDTETAIKAVGYKAISIFSGDDASSIVLEKLWSVGVRCITIRSAGYNNIHLKTAKRIGFQVANAPDYSPYAIAEHATALLLALNRKIIRADHQVHSYNFLQDNLMGYDLHGKTVGIIGTGRIGSIMVKIMHGFGCKVLANDLVENNNLVELGDVIYTDINNLCSKSDIISLHIPLTHENYSYINKEKLALMKKGVVLINSARGSIVETKALIKALELGNIGGYATDVYEKEKGVFFKDNSKTGIKDEQLKNLLSFPNVLMTPHQGFITKEALTNIAEITFYNIDCWDKGVISKNELGLENDNS
ncbi:2-hydroxyacid dehydrogenase [Maribacter sp. ACAM166]|uniref:2-hydroxyacid dehydrogenase n=1 Tax=Maribacter sp. ACAM166 TaxID=2508996 RepID=UPI0010FDDDBB|nr:2-hydroxyacid dehydrogenase [Maribacter sp. ACAM166]TLP79811.1 2-hydroxyacid dehydrogenase [Maribacter sp. ACAM166]